MKACYSLSAFDGVVRRDHPDIAVVNLGSPFAASIAPWRHWRLVYFDFCAAVYLRPGADLRWPLLDVGERLRQMSREMEGWSEAAQIQSFETVPSFLLAAGDFVEAGQWASQAAERWPKRWLSHATLGRCLQLSGEPAGAIVQLKSAIENGAESPNVWHDLVVSQAAIQDLEGASAAAAAAIEKFPHSADAWATRGAVELKKGSPSSALPFLDEAVSLAPDDSEILAVRAYCLIQLRRAGEAIPSLQKALRLSPDSFEANYQMADALHETGDDASAGRFLEKAKGLVPNDPRITRLEEEIGRAVPQVGSKR